MPDSPETTDLEALIKALISKANDRLQRQLDDVRRHPEGAHEQAENLTEAHNARR